jgi:hypothetical protein
LVFWDAARTAVPLLVRHHVHGSYQSLTSHGPEVIPSQKWATDNDGALNTGGKPFIFQQGLGFQNCAEDFD